MMSRRELTGMAIAMATMGSLRGLASADPAGKRNSIRELSSLSAREAAKHIRDGAITAESYVGALLQQYRLHRDLNAVISIHADSVLEAASAIDKDRSRGRTLGALAGVPFVVKDQIDVAGYASTAGTPALRHYVPKRNALVVEILLQSGAIMFAKANMHELAFGGTSSNPTYGDVRNPYDPRRIPGGSSGGTGAALAARMVPLGLGEDTGGSVRIPAGFCGVSGLRPSTWPTKRYSDAGLVPAAAPDDTQTIGPMARSVSDVSLLDAVITGTPESQPLKLRGIRLGVPQESFWADRDVDRGVAETIHTAFESLRAAGVILVPVDLQKIMALAAPLPFIASDSRKRFANWLKKNVPGVSFDDVVRQIASADVRAIFEAPLNGGAERSAQERARLRARAVEAYGRLYRESGIVALAFPNPIVTAPLRVKGGDPVDLQIEINGHRSPFKSVVARCTTFASRMGSPALTFPAGMAEGLPVGLELEALPGQDRFVLALGMACERVLGPLPAPPMLG